MFLYITFFFFFFFFCIFVFLLSVGNLAPYRCWPHYREHNNTFAMCLIVSGMFKVSLLSMRSHVLLRCF